jgi:hypothetical protein
LGGKLPQLAADVSRPLKNTSVSLCEIMFLFNPLIPYLTSFVNNNLYTFNILLKKPAITGSCPYRASPGKLIHHAILFRSAVFIFAKFIFDFPWGLCNPL